MPELRVVSYNVRGGRGAPDALAQVVRDLAPDVVIVQEAPRRMRWRTRCAQLAHSFGMVYAAGGLAALGNLLVTGLRVRAYDSWVIRYPLAPGRHLRGAVFARVGVAGVRLVVAGSHLSTDPTERPVQAQVLKKALADLDAPVVFGGDLNETSGGAGWRMLADGLRDPAVETGREAAGTYPVPDARQRIDAILVDPRIEVTGYQVVDTPAARRASDHFPVVADLRLPG